MTDEQLQEAVAAMAEHGSQVKAAAVLGIARSTLQQRLMRAASVGLLGGPPIPAIARPAPGFAITRNSGTYDADGNLLRQSVQSRREAGEVYVAPAGFAVTGESVLTDPEGRLLAKWTKTREGGASALVPALEAVFARHAGAAPLVDAPALGDDETLTVYPVADLHFGLYAWAPETGDDYDTEIATALARRTLGALVAKSEPSKRAILLVLGDYFHMNDQKNATPGSGHRLDVDGRWGRVFAAGAELVVSMVDLLAQKHAEIDVVFIPGNHDEDAAVTLRVALSLFYRSNPRIRVYNQPGLHWYDRHGKVLLGATHGHTMKPDRMAMMLATDRAKDWGETEHRHFFFGHIHHESAREVGPVRVESFQTPAPKDAWAAGGGYRSGRSMCAITFHAEHGEIGRHRVNIRQGTA